VHLLADGTDAGPNGEEDIMAETVVEGTGLPLIMGTINDFISDSVLGRPGSVFIDNAWEALLLLAPAEQRKSRADWKPASQGVKPALDSCKYLPTDPDRQGYVRGGIAKLKNSAFYGVCNDFAWVVTSLLVATKYPAPLNKKKALLPAGTRVELYGIVGTQEAKHMFTVVNRAADSDQGNYREWGPECFVVDQWYALQTGTSPVKSLVEGPGFDPVFIKWWNDIVPGTKPGKMPYTTISNRFASQRAFKTGEFLPEF
jgi:hypothetical protein